MITWRGSHTGQLVKSWVLRGEVGGYQSIPWLGKPCAQEGSRPHASIKHVPVHAPAGSKPVPVWLLKTRATHA